MVRDDSATRRTPSGRLALLLLPIALSACDGCGKTEIYRFRDVPFCANDPGARFAGDYHLLTTWSDGWGYQGMPSTMSGPADIAVFDDDVVLAVVECKGAVVKPIDDKMEELDASTVPTICPGQKVLFHDRLAADRDARAEGLGRAGFYRFPTLPLKCKPGALVANDRYTLSQILADFGESVSAYHDRHEGQLPKSLAALVADTHAPPLPPDPWGSALIYEQTGSRVVLKSAGPDTKPGTADDIEAIAIDTSSGFSSNSITVFEGTSYSMFDDYKAFIGKPRVGPAPAGSAPTEPRPSASSRPTQQWAHVRAATDDGCRDHLDATDAHTLPVIDETEPNERGCGIPRGVMMQRGPTGTTYIPTLRVDCSFATALARVERIFHEEAERLFGHRVRGFRTRGSYDCRGVVGRESERSEGLSEHSFGNAIDVAAVDLTNGKRITVVAHHSHPELPEGRFLRTVMARIESELGLRALGPDFDSEHRDHIHIDAGSRSDGE